MQKLPYVILEDDLKDESSSFLFVRVQCRIHFEFYWCNQCLFILLVCRTFNTYLLYKNLNKLQITKTETLHSMNYIKKKKPGKYPIQKIISRIHRYLLTGGSLQPVLFKFIQVLSQQTFTCSKSRI